MLRWGKGFAQVSVLAIWPALGSMAAASTPIDNAAPQAGGERQAHRWSGRAPGNPATLWLWYADGSEQPVDCFYGTTGKAPPFKCNYGTSIEDCQRQVQAELDTIYADFNLVFTLSKPPTGDFYTMIITSDASWCQTSSASTEAGVTLFNNCIDNPGAAAFAFECGYSAHACATLIAHEHGHMVGLEHTVSTTDVMNQYVLSSATGFDNQSDQVLLDDDRCGLGKQNSYQTMLTALGPWPGGAKPSPFSSTRDAGVADAPPVVQPHDASDEAPDKGAIGNPTGGGSDGEVVGSVGGYDALVRPPLPTVGDSGASASAPHGGCDLAGRPTSGIAALLALLCALAAAATRTRSRCRRGLPAPPASEPLPCVAPAPTPSLARALDR